MSAITEITRRNILDEIRLGKIRWYGRLTEGEFLNRIVNLRQLPSEDERYSNMEDDWYQHRVNNGDWDDDWIFTDSRLDFLHCDEERFLRLLAEIVHPIVQTDPEEVLRIVELFNHHLSHDGVKLMPSMTVSGRDVFEPVRLDMINIEVEAASKLSEEFILEQLKKCDRKIKENDSDGAITNARSFVEGILGDIYQQCTGATMPKTGDLTRDYKEIKKLLNLSAETQTDAALKAIAGGMSSVIYGLDALSNEMGDRHRRRVKPERRHAKLAVNAAKAITDFLYDTLQDQKKVEHILLEQLIRMVDERRNWSHELLSTDPNLKSFLDQCDQFQKNLLKRGVITKFKVGSFRAADIFFAAMRLFLKDLSHEDIPLILENGTTNDQLVGMDAFIKLLHESRPDLMPTDRFDKLQNTYFLRAKCMRGEYSHPVQ